MDNIDMSQLQNSNFNSTPIQQLNDEINRNMQGNNQQYYPPLNNNNNNYQNQQQNELQYPSMQIDESILDGLLDNTSKKDIVIKYVKKTMLILIIYVIFSLDIVKLNIGKYISYINPNTKGDISIYGYIIYGLIIACIIVAAEKLLL